ncbi:MAG: uroporphyrinogen-III synthase, partial [Neisseriaceae bacterium]|nr:uroporphyrinogen-III synthase [Neisseriaceae bacterium]
RSEIALPISPAGLTSLGFETVTVTAYSNVMPSEVKKVDLNEISRIVFSSPSTIDNFERLYGSLPADIEYVARGPVTERHLQNILSKYQL